MKSTQQETITGLDLGSNMIRVAIGRRCESGIEIIGVGQSPSQGMRKGMVVTPENTAAAIRQAVNEARLMAGCEVRDVVASIAGLTVRSQNSQAGVQLERGTVCEQDILRVIESARAIQLPPGREILQAIPREYVVDKQTKTIQPLGMPGSRLEAEVHLVTIESASIKSCIQACRISGLKGLNFALQSLATAETVLLQAERDKGVVLIDFGGRTTDLAVFSSGTLYHTSKICSVSDQLTCDLAIGLRIKMNDAEQLKILHGSLENLVNSDDVVEIDRLTGGGKQMIPRQLIVEILGARMGEVFGLIAKELNLLKHNREPLAGVVITGGCSLLPGLEELAKRELNMPVRIARPVKIMGVTDTVSMAHHATAVGLVLLGGKVQMASHVKENRVSGICC